MKKIILILLVVALAVPSAALAAAEFSLGGFIKLDSFWDSTQEGKNMNGVIARNNDPNFHHGRLKFTAQGSRFSFTIKGPKLWGATTTGYIEMDFDTTEEGMVSSYGTLQNGAPATGQRGSGTTASGSYTPRLRHAMFRLNWPETELLMGQYWSMLCEWWPEVAQDGPFQVTGIPTARLAQIRVTQKFLGAWTVSALIGEGNATANDRTFSFVDHVGGESAEMPQIQGKVMFQQDLWGKAAYQGVPTPFTAQVVAGVQRNDFSGTSVVDGDAGFVTARPFGESAYGAALTTAGVHNTYLYPWIVMGTVFIPVIPTTSANLAGTASISTQWYIGQGVDAFGFAGIGSNFLHWNGTTGLWDFQLGQRFGGYAQAQYYFNNQWFLTAAYAMSRAFGISSGETDPTSPAAGDRANALIGATGDQMNYQSEYDLCLWYRPIQALKFGLQYSYVRTNYFQTAFPSATNNPNNTTNTTSKFGDAHRVEFVGYFFF